MQVAVLHSKTSLNTSGRRGTQRSESFRQFPKTSKLLKACENAQQAVAGIRKVVPCQAEKGHKAPIPLDGKEEEGIKVQAQLTGKQETTLCRRRVHFGGIVIVSLQALQKMTISSSHHSSYPDLPCSDQPRQLYPSDCL